MSEEARKREDDYYAGTMKDDYISRKAVLDMLEEECGSCADAGYIFSLPGIEKRKTGTWIEVDPKGVWTSVYHCSECGGAVMSCKVDLPKYCGHCGARMEGMDETD